MPRQRSPRRSIRRFGLIGRTIEPDGPACCPIRLGAFDGTDEIDTVKERIDGRWVFSRALGFIRTIHESLAPALGHLKR